MNFIFLSSKNIKLYLLLNSIIVFLLCVYTRDTYIKSFFNSSIKFIMSWLLKLQNVVE
jgi:hypothetical protein